MAAAAGTGAGGRPVKLSDTVQHTIVAALSVGATHEHAALSAGVSYRTFRRWMARGETATRGQFWQFCQAVKNAEANAAVRWLALIEKAANEGTWQAAAWKLERRYPELWGRRDRVQVDHSGEVQVQATVEARTVVLAALRDFPEARFAVAAALAQLDAAWQQQQGVEADEHDDDDGDDERS